MQLGKDKFGSLTVTKKLSLGPNATMNVNGTDVSLTELQALGGTTASAAELNILDGCTATAAELNMAADNSANAEVVTATNVITAAESGSTYFLNSATEFVSTLPAPALGLRFTFIVKAAPAAASYTIIAAAAATNIVGHVVCSEDAGGTSDSEVSGVNAITLVDSKAVVGDRVDVISDGTLWYASIKTKVFDGATLS